MYHRGEQYHISKNWNLYIFLQRNALIGIKISIIDICYTNMAPISKTLMFYLLHEWKIQWKRESWKIYHHAGDSCPPNHYRSLLARTYFSPSLCSQEFNAKIKSSQTKRNLQYCEWLNFLGVPIFVVFEDGPIHEFQYPGNCYFLYTVMIR